MPNRKYTRSCDCGTCAKCKHRALVMRWNAEHPEQAKEIRKRAYEKNKERRSADALAWQLANPEKAREIKRRYHVKNRFGLSWEEYQALHAIRGDVCWICGSDDPKRGKMTMCVDHDHATGKVRGLLCYDCNNGLSQFGDDPARLLAAAAYLSGADLT